MNTTAGPTMNQSRKDELASFLGPLMSVNAQDSMRNVSICQLTTAMINKDSQIAHYVELANELRGGFAKRRTKECYKGNVATRPYKNDSNALRVVKNKP